MIPDTHITIDGDTALWVMGDHQARNCDEVANRPCDTCGGKPWFDKVWWTYDPPDRLNTLPDERFDVVRSTCPACDGTGRHTFEVETYCDNRDWIAGSEPKCPRSDNGIRTLRVNILDVLPIVDAGSNENPEATHYSIEESGCWLWEWDETVSDFICHEDIYMPPAAESGMWLVRLEFH